MDAAGAGRVSGKGLTLPAVGDALFAVHLQAVQCLSRGGCCGVLAALGTLLLSPTSAGHAGPGRASHHGVPGPREGMRSPRPPPPSGTSFQHRQLQPCRRCWEQVGSQRVPGVGLCCSSVTFSGARGAGRNGGAQLGPSVASGGARQDLTRHSHRDVCTGPQAAPCTGMDAAVAGTATSGCCCVCAEGPAAPGRAGNRPACLHNAAVAMGEVRGPGDVRARRGGVWGGGPCPAPC